MVEREHMLRAPDGWTLHVVEVCPPEPRATVIAGHAMMVDRRTLWRSRRTPSLVGTLVEAGLRVLVPDLRGHGHSGPTASEGGRWSYDDLVADTALYLDLARELQPNMSPLLVGHSLFGHTSLAYLARHAPPVGALALLGVNVWARRWTPSRWRWVKKRAVMEGVAALAEVMGRMPAKRFGYGSADEALPYWRDMARVVRSNRWVVQGADLTEGLARIDAPVMVVVSEGDRLYAHPDDALAFTSALPRRSVLRVGTPKAPAPLRALRPDHMGLVTRVSSQPVWTEVASWLVEHAAPKV